MQEGPVVVVEGGQATPPVVQTEPTRGAAVGLGELQTLRLLLDTCATVDEAKQTLMATKQYYQYVPIHYLVADRTGAAFVYSSSIGSALKWFKDRRGLASGIMAAGFGGGTALFIPLISWLIRTHGYQKTFLVTGANSGIGRALVEALAARGGNVVLAARSEERTRPVLDEIRLRYPGVEAQFLLIDVSDLAAVALVDESSLGPLLEPRTGPADQTGSDTGIGIDETARAVRVALAGLAVDQGVADLGLLLHFHPGADHARAAAVREHHPFARWARGRASHRRHRAAAGCAWDRGPVGPGAHGPGGD